MQISTAGLNTLKNREKLRLNAYLDSNGTPTIGWGCTYYESGSKVRIGDTITEARAVQLLNFHIGVAAAGVNKNITANLNQSQFDALVSFVYNVGEPRFRTSTLRKVVNENPNNHTAIAAQFRSWKYETIKGVKTISNGLIARREEEIRMYQGGVSPEKKKSGSSQLLS